MRASWLVLLMLDCCSVSTVRALPAEVQSQVDAGKQVFAASCVVCHGDAGRGALGPALADRNLTLDLIRQTISEGRVGSVMPAFQDTLDAKSLAQVVAYVWRLSTGGLQPQTLVSSESPPGAGAPLSLPIAAARSAPTSCI